MASRILEIEHDPAVCPFALGGLVRGDGQAGPITNGINTVGRHPQYDQFIDNGFGAGHMAALINELAYRDLKRETVKT